MPEFEVHLSEAPADEKLVELILYIAQRCEDDEHIPYEMVFVDTRPLTESEKEYGRVLANEELDGGR